MLRAVLVDVGGTLWPDRLTGDRSDDPILARLAKLLPGIAPAESLAALRARSAMPKSGSADFTAEVASVGT